MNSIYEINSVRDYLKLRQQEVLHPLVAVVDFNKVSEEGKTVKGYNALRFNCYAVFLKDATGCKLKYGGKHYDYDEGTLVFVGPKQLVELTYDDPNFKPKGYALLFHPDLLLGSELAKKIHGYSYFSYAVNEALHLSAKERKVILSLLEKIEFELEQSIDKHSKKLIVSNIELFLDYCVRFYDRQFLTREVENSGVISNFESSLNAYMKSGKARELGTPTVGYFAGEQHLSPNYFGDLVKKETGKSAHEFIQAKIIELAKEQIFDPEKNLSEIAYDLGFKYPQHFSRFFKNKVGYSPNEYRMLN